MKRSSDYSEYEEPAENPPVTLEVPVTDQREAQDCWVELVREFGLRVNGGGDLAGITIIAKYLAAARADGESRGWNSGRRDAVNILTYKRVMEPDASAHAVLDEAVKALIYASPRNKPRVEVSYHGTKEKDT